MKKIICLLAFFTLCFANAQDYDGVIDSYLNTNRTQLGFQVQDIEDVTVNSQSFSNSMQLDNVYVVQRYQGIEIFNSNSSFAIKNNAVVKANLSFSQNISEKINTTNSGITASMAIVNGATVLGLQSPSNLVLLETFPNNTYLFSNGNISLENIPVKLVFQPTQDNKLRLAWDLSIYILDASHYYSIRIDAVTGELLDTIDWVVSCDFGEKKQDQLDDVTIEAKSILFPQEEAISFTAGGAQYRVFALPFESPNHGPDALIADPSDNIASPFGWHDTNGSPGAEFTITRGNNVLAQDDINGNNGSGISADGGAGLNFDFPYDFINPPADMIEASTVNLFYWNNIMHDVWYQYGFDEASGNFQENNYGNGGAGSDFVNADAQDGSGTNNANFSTPPDGSNPRMQMFLWTSNSGPVDILTINNGPLAGVYSGVPAAFGGPLPVPPLTQDLILVEDNDAGPSTDPNDACDPITNGGALNGKIAVIRRGECEFGFKALAAENQGAVAVIMVNNVGGAPIVMAGGAVGGSVTIPLFMVSNTDGEAIITELGGATINGTISGENVPPAIDGDLDNGIVMHEYGHGVSIRLTGGPNNSGCLNNAEQMGEGWSDWFAIMLTMEVGDQPGDIRGVGTYATGQPIDGGGIRPAPYSTDFGINGFTYGDIPGLSIPHGVGFVWATMIWDLNWALIEEYGFDPDFYNGTGGNNIAMQLVIDGLKLQNCSPGFVNGRDAILEADELANGGANFCLIWNAFAHRGLGLSASQGSAFSTTDQTEAFDVPSECILGIDYQGSLDNNFIIYPNPSNGNINIKSIIDLGDVTVTIFDINGRNVYTQDIALHDTVKINAERLNTGIYIIEINTDNYKHTAKLIIE